MGYSFFNVGIMMVAPKGRAPGRRAGGRKGKKVQKGKRSKSRAFQDAAQTTVAAAKRRDKVAYPLVPVPPHSDHLKAYTSSLATVQHLLPVDLCTDPLPVLATIISLLDTTVANENAAEVDRQKTAEAMCYLTKCLTALTSLVDPSAPSVSNAFTPDVIPSGESGHRCRSSRTLLFDIARGLAYRVPLTKLVELDGNVWPHLATLMVATLVWAHKMLTIPDALKLC